MTCSNGYRALFEKTETKSFKEADREKIVKEYEDMNVFSTISGN